MKNIRNNFRLASVRRIISDKRYEKKNNLLNKIDDITRIAKHLVSFGIATGFLIIFWYCSIVIRWMPISIYISNIFYFLMISLWVGIILIIISYIAIIALAILISILSFFLDLKCLLNKLFENKTILTLLSIVSIAIIMTYSKFIMERLGIFIPNTTIQLSDSDYKFALNEARLRNQNLNFLNNNRIHNVNILWHGIGSHTLVEFQSCEKNETFRMAVKTDEIKIITPTYPKPTNCSADRSAEHPQPKHQPHVRTLETANSILPPQHNNRQRRRPAPNKTTGNMHSGANYQ